MRITFWLKWKDIVCNYYCNIWSKQSAGSKKTFCQWTQNFIFELKEAKNPRLWISLSKDKQQYATCFSVSSSSLGKRPILLSQNEHSFTESSFLQNPQAKSVHEKLWYILLSCGLDLTVLLNVLSSCLVNLRFIVPMKRVHLLSTTRWLFRLKLLVEASVSCLLVWCERHW